MNGPATERMPKFVRAGEHARVMYQRCAQLATEAENLVDHIIGSEPHPDHPRPEKAQVRPTLPVLDEMDELHERTFAELNRLERNLERLRRELPESGRPEPGRALSIGR